MIHNEQPFYRIHKANLISFGILPLEFVREEELKRISPGDRLRIGNLIPLVQEGKTLPPENVTQRFVVGTHLNIFPRLREILLAGGFLTYS